MTDPYPAVAVRVWGEFACFTRPEMKVERVSYPVMTPSAARGVLEAIYWKPEFRWRVAEIWVLNEISYWSVLRNEINSRASEGLAHEWAKNGGGYFAPADRAQRHTLALRNVDYVIRAFADPQSHAGEDPAKYRDQFRRRVREGRCFATPYLGCREFAASFAEPDGAEEQRLIGRTEELGPMLLDLEYEPPSEQDGRLVYSGRGRPRFFDARLDHGILRVPTLDSRVGEGRDAS